MVKIKKIKTTSKPNEHLLGFSLDNPQKSFITKREPFFFKGWVVGKDVKINKIEINVNGFFWLESKVDKSRPEVGCLYPNNPSGDLVGFDTNFNIASLPHKFDIELFVPLNNGTKQKIFHIKGENPFSYKYPDGMRPIVVTSLGRTGTTYLLGLLGAHPEVTVYRPFMVEARYASYWFQLYLNMMDPKSWVYPMGANDRSDPNWVLGDECRSHLFRMPYPKTFGWFQNEYGKNVYEFCMRSLQEHYLHIAEIQKKPHAVYFCEKFLPDQFTDSFCGLVPHAKEIFLVRDFRDMVCSIEAFNKKRGHDSFGREHYANTNDYIREHVAFAQEMMVRSWEKRKNNALLVKYEELISKPSEALEKIFEFLNISSTEKSVLNAIKWVDKNRTRRQEAHKTVRDKHLSLKRYEREMAPETIAICNRYLQEGLAVFGYDV